MQYVTTAERIGIKKGVEKGVLIGQILMLQRMLGHPVYPQDELKSKTLEELEHILGKAEAKMT